MRESVSKDTTYMEGETERILQKEEEGGVIIYAQDSITCCEKEMSTTFHQICGITTHDIDIFSMYKSSNACSDDDNALELFLASCKKKTLVLGAFNHPSIDWEAGYSAVPKNP